MKRFLPAILLAGLVLLAPDCGAETVVEEASVEGLIETLGTPARAPAVREALGGLALRGDAYGTTLAEALARTGGPEAAAGLARLLRSRSAVVRVAALEAAATLRLRDATLRRAAGRAARKGKTPVRAAALRALAWIGDGEHVPTMINALGHDDASVRHAAIQALRRVTHVHHAPVVPRWANWWPRFQERSRKELQAVMGVVAADPSKANLATMRAFLNRYGWTDLGRVQDTLDEFLKRKDPAVQIEVCAIVQSLRLVDLGEEVHSLYQWTRNDEVQAAARSCLEALRIPRQCERSSD